MVPSTPGGGADVLARSIGPKLSEGFGKPVVIENRAGAGGIIGYEIVAQAPPDGYTMLIVAGGYTLNPSLYAKLPYDTLRDFERVSLITCAPNLLVVHGSVPVKSVQELIAFAKGKPGYLNYASSGVGTTSYLSAEIFKSMTGVDMTHVPYKGAGASTAAAIAGEVHLIFCRRTRSCRMQRRDACERSASRPPGGFRCCPRCLRSPRRGCRATK